MNTNSIKSFAKAARLSVLKSVSNRLTFWNIQPDSTHGQGPEAVTGGYIYKGNPYDDVTVPDKWNRLAARVSDKQSYIDLQEEASYTWFNRFMVIKIMEVNGYLSPTLAMVDGTNTPHILHNAKLGIHNLTKSSDIHKLNDYIAHSEDEKALQILLFNLFNTQDVLQVIFGNVASYMDLLLPANLLAEEGFLKMLENDGYITNDMYREVELIGWLYQFYISDKKDEVFKGFKNNKKARAQDIPAATQIFTPKWIVKYMVENTVGKIYLDYEPDSDLEEQMKYLVKSVEASKNAKDDAAIDTGSTTNYNIQKLQDLTLLDPACGSGHILVVGFELLMDMYREQGYTKKKAVKLILEHNLYGLDIDNRAMQLARLAILLKAASYDDNILREDIPIPHIYAFPQAHSFSSAEIGDFLQTREEGLIKEAIDALALIAQGKNLGSIIKLSISDAAKESLKTNAVKWKEDYSLGRMDVFKGLFFERLSNYLQILEILTRKYTAVVANPPYMGQKNMNPDLKNFVNKNYKLSKSDLFAVFMEVCIDLTMDNGLMGMINQHSWMFLSSYEKLRTEFMQSYLLRDMLHLGPRTFEELSGEVVQSTAFVFQNIRLTTFGNATGNYHRLVEYKSVVEKEENFHNLSDFYPNIPQTNFSKIPGSPIAYWVSENVLLTFKSGLTIHEIAPPRIGMMTTDNKRFLRIWSEVSIKSIKFDCVNKSEAIESEMKWFPYNKGGGYRKWYGNNFNVVNWKNGGKEIIDNGMTSFRGKDFYFKEGITWSDVSSSSFACRYTDSGKIFDITGTSSFPGKDLIYKVIAVQNSIYGTTILNILNPTLHYQSGDIRRIPFSNKLKRNSKIDKLVKNCIDISRSDWNERETSYDFKTFKLVSSSTLKKAFEQYLISSCIRFNLLLEYEVEINKEICDAFDLDLLVEVKPSAISILEFEIDKREIRASTNSSKYEILLQSAVIMSQFISYCVGLMMGRYRLDEPGLNIAHPDPSKEELSSYVYNEVTVDIDDDAIIPLMGKDCNFQDDILVRLDTILTAIWSKDTLTENKNFLQECLEMPLHKFVTEKFWTYHYKTMYKKKPIYWLFTSDPKKPHKAAFKVLVYMHRMDRFTLSKVRNQYLHPHQEHLQSQYDGLNARVETLGKEEAKRMELLDKQIIECRAFDDRLKVLANQQITFDLDDGVTENYNLFAGVVGELK